MDLGAKDPGYVLDSTDMHQEGLIFPGTRIVKAGARRTAEIFELIRFNSRLPDARDRRLQRADRGRPRPASAALHEISSNASAATRVRRRRRLILDHGERLTRAALRQAARRAPGPRRTGSTTTGSTDDADPDAGDGHHRRRPRSIVDFAGSSRRRAGPGEHAVRRDREPRQGGPQGAHHARRARRTPGSMRPLERPGRARARSSTPSTRRRRSRSGAEIVALRVDPQGARAGRARRFRPPRAATSLAS